MKWFGRKLDLNFVWVSILPTLRSKKMRFTYFQLCLFTKWLKRENFSSFKHASKYSLFRSPLLWNAILVVNLVHFIYNSNNIQMVHTRYKHLFLGKLSYREGQLIGKGEYQLRPCKETKIFWSDTILTCTMVKLASHKASITPKWN